MNISIFWRRHGNKIAIAFALCVMIFVASIFLRGEIGAYSHNAEKTTDGLLYVLGEDAVFADLAVAPNHPEFGMVTISGALATEKDLARLRTMIDEGGYRSGILALRIEVKVDEKGGR